MIFNITQNNFQNTMDSIIEQNIQKFRYYIEKDYTEPPKNFDSELWNKLFTKNKNGELEKDKYKVFRTDNSILDILLDDISRNEKQIIKWCNNRYINSKLFINFLKNFSKYYLTNDFNVEDNPLDFADLLKNNFNKVLTTNTHEEKILRSFLYGKPSQFSILLRNNFYGTILNTQKFKVRFAEPFYSNQPNETLTNLSNNMTFYLEYSVSDININEINAKILNQIDLKWIISAIPSFVNPITSFETIITNINNKEYIDYYNEHSVQMLKKEIINNWNSELIIWTTNDTPILKDYYLRLYKSLTLKN